MAQNTPLELINFNPLKGRGKYNQAIPGGTTITTLESLNVNIDITVEVVEIQILDGTVIYTTDGAVPTEGGNGMRWRVSANEAWAVLSRAEAKELKMIALVGQSPKINISPKALAIKQ